jgi:hypothetical protein
MSKNNIGLIKNSDLIWASGTFLTTKLPKNFPDFSQNRLFKFLENNAWEPFEGSKGEWIWEQIENLAWSMREHVKK